MVDEQSRTERGIDAFQQLVRHRRARSTSPTVSCLLAPQYRCATQLNPLPLDFGCSP
jgi:hypothetical protein